MDKGIQLEKGKIYKLKTKQGLFKRNYMIFSPKETFYLSGLISLCKNTIFTIDLEGEFKLDSSIGLWVGDKIVDLNMKDWLEVGQFLRATEFRFNLRTKELRNKGLDKWEITEI
jgi:hypothetical protein